jgi:tetratricopeptide (TPR) repeat protein
MDSKSVLARFEQERQALALMDHPNIAKVYDGDLTESGQPYFVMEFIDGTPLGRFSDDARLDVRQRLELFIPVCLAVQHAHQKGVVHRDLKPSNILVAKVDGRPTPKVIDFGVAKAVTGKLTEASLSTQFGSVVGTLEYMAPEQAVRSTADVDTRSDVYSLGVVFYGLLTGLRPFDTGRLCSAAFDDVLRILREEDPPSLSSRLGTDASLATVAANRKTEPRRLVAQLKDELDWITRRCLEKDRDRRYATAVELAAEIQRYSADEPVEARPAGTIYKLRKFVRRNRGPVIAAGTLLLTLAGGVAGTTSGLVAAWRSAAAEKSARLDADAFRLRETVRAEKEKQETLEAQTRLERALQVSSTTLGPSNAHSIANMKNLAKAYIGEGKFDLALPLLEEAFRLTKDSKAPDHPQTFAIAIDLAEGYLAAAKLDKAIPLLEDALRTGKRFSRSAYISRPYNPNLRGEIVHPESTYVLNHRPRLSCAWGESAQV